MIFSDGSAGLRSKRSGCLGHRIRAPSLNVVVLSKNSASNFLKSFTYKLNCYRVSKRKITDRYKTPSAKLLLLSADLLSKGSLNVS